MLWLYIIGLVFLVGSEVNVVLEHYHPKGKNMGEKKSPTRGARNSGNGR